MTHRNPIYPLRLLGLVALFAVLCLPASTAVPQDNLVERRARVANMMGTGTMESSHGGLQILLAFEDAHSPDRLVLWVDKQLYDRTTTGDLFIVRYRADGTLVDFVGPIRE